MYHLLFYNTNDDNIASYIPFLAIAKPCTHLHTATSTSTQLHPPLPSSIRFHPAYFNIHPALCSIFNFIRTKILPGQFPQIWAEKLKVAHFDWKLAYMVSWRCWFQIRTSIFEIPTPKSILGQIWTGNVKVVRFAWNLAYTLSQGCWFLFRH